MAKQPILDDSIRALPCWRGPIAIEPLPGGLTNRNYLVTCRGERFVVRRGFDCPAHGIERVAEAAISAAAARASLAPPLIYADAGFLVLRHIDGRTLRAEDLSRGEGLAKAITLLRQCRDSMPAFCDFALPDRRPIRLLDHYAGVLAAPGHRWHAAFRRHEAALASLREPLAARPQGFAHNDVHAGNLIDDGARVWLIDWEYAGAGDPLLDLASLANNGLVAADTVDGMVRAWSDGAGDTIASFPALRLAAALRDLFWGYVQDGLTGGLDAYISANEQRVAKCALP